MRWLLAPESPGFYVPSAVLIFWSALFLLMRHRLGSDSRPFLAWGGAFAVQAAFPLVKLLSPCSSFLACVVFWFVESASAYLLIMGLFRAVWSPEGFKLYGVVYAGVSVLALAFLAILPSVSAWLGAVCCLRAAFLLCATVLYALRYGKLSETLLILALLVTAGSSGYDAFSLYTADMIRLYFWTGTLNALLLSITFSGIVLLRATENVNAARARLSSLVENSTLGLAFLGPGGELLQANGRMLEILGVEEDLQAEGRGTASEAGLGLILSRCSPDKKVNEITVNFDRLKAAGAKTNRTGEAKLSVCVRKIRDDGKEGTFLQIDDLSELKNTLSELIEKRYSMDLMFRAAGACEFRVEESGVYSPCWFNALGYGFASAEPQEFLELIHPQDRHKFPDRLFLSGLQPGAPFNTEARVRNADGSYIWYFFSSGVERIDGKAVTLGMVMNIDLHKRMESFAMQNDRLAAVGQLANGVAHDINNYLMTMKTSMGMIGVSADEKQKQKFAAYMQEAIENSSSMLKRLLSFSKGDETEHLPVSMNGLLCTVKEMLSRSLTSGIKLKYTCESEKDVILGNYYELENIILNIGLNARDALPEQGGEIAIRTFVADENPLKPGIAGWFCISIRDNGCGMSAEVQKRIFDPFFTTKPHGKGSGLGLFTAYGYVQRHGGTISVESAPGAGTDFLLAFPLLNA